MDEKQPTRNSFVKEKVGNFQTGPTGITGTTSRATIPTERVDTKIVQGDLNCNASDLLFKNIDQLGKTLNITKENNHNDELDELNDTEESILDFDDLTEDQIIADLDKHIYDTDLSHAAPIAPSDKYIHGKEVKMNTRDKFCRNCGQQYNKEDNFCGACGNKRA